MLEITDLNKLKFTKIRYHRINFKYDNKLYSLNSHEDGGDYSLILWDRDNKEFIASDYDYLRLNEYIKVNHGKRKVLVYSHIDKNYFVDRINEFIKRNKRKR